MTHYSLTVHGYYRHIILWTELMKLWKLFFSMFIEENSLHQSSRFTHPWLLQSRNKASLLISLTIRGLILQLSLFLQLIIHSRKQQRDELCFSSLYMSAADVCMHTVEPQRGAACTVGLFISFFPVKIRCLLLRALRAEHIFTPWASVIKVKNWF